MPAPAGIGAAFANEAAGLLEIGKGIANQGEADYLVNADPPGVIAKVGVAAARAGCRVFAQDPGSYDANTQRVFTQRCSPYLDSIGFPLSDGGIIVPPFGGQCDNIAYGYVYTATQFIGNPPEPTEVQTTGSLGFGPITSTRQSLVVNGQPLEQWSVQGFAAPGQQGGPVVSNLIISANFNSGNPQIRNGNYRITTDPGVLDVCGNQPGDYEPPGGNPPPDGGPDFRFNPSPDIDINFTVELFPDANIRFDFGDGPQERDLDPDPTGGGGGEDPGASGEPGSTGEPGPGGEDEGEDPNRILVGVLVTITSMGPTNNTRIRAGEEFAIGAYAVGMGGDAGLQLSDTADFSQTSQFHYAPENANRYKVWFNRGVSGQVTPYWRDAQE